MSGGSENIGGIDEAGKGSVIGPMVIAGVSCRKDLIPELKNNGIRDSKRLTPKRRRELYDYIKKRAECFVKIIEAEEIDRMREKKTMNEILLSGFGEIAHGLECSQIYVDSPDVDRKRFGKRLEEMCGRRVFSLHRADETVTVVMAASIVAKVERDSMVERIKESCGVDFGSGYPADPKTRKFLSECMDRGEIPDFIRTSWRTLDRIRNMKFSTRIESWL